MTFNELCERNLIEVFPYLTTILKIYVTLPIVSCEAERIFSQLLVIKTNFVEPC